MDDLNKNLPMDSQMLQPWTSDPDAIRTWKVARTNVQLYNQLIAQGRPLEELVRVRDAYRLSMQLYAGKYGSDESAFITHPIGVASIMAGLGYATDYVVVSVVHNIYRNADWGDARGRSKRQERRARATEYLGDDVEALLSRFDELRIKRDSFPGLLEEAERMDDRDRGLLTIELADYWEKYCDLSVGYYGVERWDITLAEQHHAELVELARRLGHPALADLLDQAIATVAVNRIPEELRGDTQWSQMTIAPSLMVRPWVRFWTWLRPLIRRLRDLFR